MRSHCRSPCSLITISICAFVTLVSCGCYQHVVRADGYGAQRMDVYEPSVRDDSTVYGGAKTQTIQKSVITKPVVIPPRTDMDGMARPSVPK